MYLLVFLLTLITLSCGQEPPPHIYSTLFMAFDMRDHLGTDQGISEAIAWCKDHGITQKVYMETWRDGLLVDRNIMLRAKGRFEEAGYNVSGCIATTKIGKPSTGWDAANCYTNSTTQRQLQSIFSYTASIFNEIIIDDFYFTDCECSECTAARDAHTVTVGAHVSHYEDTVDHSCYDPEQPCPWADYRRNLMQQVSKWCVLDETKNVNPNITVIIKFPDWYDMFQDFGYDTLYETLMFPKIWAGTEFRNYEDAMKPPYGAFVEMRWLIGIGGDKCGGGWYDPFSSSTQTYIEQARMTILGGAKESFLFVYGSLITDGKADVEALRQNQPELLAVAKEVATREIVGVAAYKPSNSHGGCIVDPQHSTQCKGETFIFDFVGMLGIPLIPVHDFPSPQDYQAAFFSTHALFNPDLTKLLADYINSGNPTLVTDQLKAILGEAVNFNLPNVFVLPVHQYPPFLLTSPPANLEQIRNSLLTPFGLTFSAPVNCSVFPFTDGSYVIENFADNAVDVTYNGQKFPVDARSWVYKWK